MLFNVSKNKMLTGIFSFNVLGLCPLAQQADYCI